MTVLVLWGRGLFNGTQSAAEVWGILSDGFLLPGVLMAGIGALSWISQEGLFDIFGYGWLTLVSHFDHTKERESYYDYKVRREEKRSGWLWQMLAVGLCCLALSAACVGGYYVCS